MCWGFSFLPFPCHHSHIIIINTKQKTHRALPGLNSAAVGLIASAVVAMIFSVTGSSSPFPKASVCIGMCRGTQQGLNQTKKHFFITTTTLVYTGIIGFAAVDVLDVPAPLAVALGGGLGALAHVLNAV